MFRNTRDEHGMNSVHENAGKPGTSDNTSTKNFTCSWCNKSFGYKFNLDRHIQIHIGDKLYSCNWCNKSYCQKSTLDRHV
jgi:uncharacterized Zn-finger protein